MRFSNILLVLDSGAGNELALERAIRLARTVNAGITVCDVVDDIPRDHRRLITSITPRELTDSIVVKRRERIQALLGAVDSKGVSIGKEVLVGKAHVEIARLVRAGGYDLVIKLIAGQRVNRARFITRDIRMLMRHCPCSVWLVNVAELLDDGCIVAALDNPADGMVSNELNEHILQVARSIALATFRTLHVLHAWTLPGEYHLRLRASDETNRKVDRMVAEEAAERTSWLRKAVYTARSESEQVATEFLAPRLHVVKGFVGRVLPDLAQELRAGLIVMGTAARSGLPGVLIGNTSEKVVFRSDCSLLIVKQPGSSHLPEFARAVESRALRPASAQVEMQHVSMSL